MQSYLRIYLTFQASNHTVEEDNNNNNFQKNIFLSSLQITGKNADTRKGKGILKRKAAETNTDNTEDLTSIQNPNVRPRPRTISEIMAEDPLEGTSKEVKVFKSKEQANVENRFTFMPIDHFYFDEKDHQTTNVKKPKPMVVTNFILKNIKHLGVMRDNESTDTNSTETAEESNSPTDILQTDVDMSQVYEDNNSNNNNMKRVKHFIYGSSVPKNPKQKNPSAEMSTKNRSNTKKEPERLITPVHKNVTMHIQRNATRQDYEKPLIGRNMDEAVPYYEPRPDQHFEGSNPYKLESPLYPPIYAKEHSSNISGPECESFDKVLAELENYNVYIERPIWRPYTFNTGTYNREGKYNIFNII